MFCFKVKCAYFTKTREHRHGFDIGIYDTLEKAQAAVDSIRNKPGFEEHSDRIKIKKVFRFGRPKLLNQTFWSEGFVTYTESENIAPRWIIVGLGNPGITYAVTRHNAGAMCLDKIAEKYGIQVFGQKYESFYGYGSIEGQDCLLVKPQTYMNNSGIAAEKFLKKYNLPPERMIVISDDVSFDIGKMRIKRSGSSGGQNGLNSIIEHIDSQDFPRIKIGVGKKPQGCNMGDWVISNFSPQEQEEIAPVLEKGCDAAAMIVCGKIEAAMQAFN